MVLILGLAVSGILGYNNARWGFASLIILAALLYFQPVIL